MPFVPVCPLALLRKKGAKRMFCAATRIRCCDGVRVCETLGLVCLRDVPIIGFPRSFVEGGVLCFLSKPILWGKDMNERSSTNNFDRQPPSSDAKDQISPPNTSATN